MNLTTASKLDLLIAELNGEVKVTRLPAQKPRKSDLWLSSTKGVRTNTNRQGQSAPQAAIVRWVLLGPWDCPYSMNIPDLYKSIALTEELALENYHQRNGVVDYRLDGVCNHYFPKYDLQGNRDGEICLTCKVSKTVKGQFRYTFQINGKRIAERYIVTSFVELGAFQ